MSWIEWGHVWLYSDCLTFLRFLRVMVWKDQLSQAAEEF